AMDHDELQRYQQRRESLLTILLTGTAGMAFFLFLVMVTSGFFLYVLLAVSGVAGLAFLNYLLLGRSMMRDPGGEREEEELRAQSERGPWELPEPRRPRHL